MQTARFRRCTRRGGVFQRFPKSNEFLDSYLGHCMAFVILSRRNLSSSTARTLSLEAFIGLITLAMLIVLGLGLLIGSRAHRLTDDSGTASPRSLSEPKEPQEPQNYSQVLVDRIGELSARMVQLELEASGLAERLDAVKEFAQRMQEGRVPLGPIAKTPPASGGPLLEPLINRHRLESDASRQTLDVTLRDLAHQADSVSRLLTGLDRSAAEVSLAHMAFPGRSPVKKGIRTSGFGNRKDPFNRKPAFHSGVDFAAPVGTPVHASAGGKVVFSGIIGSYGQVVEIDHGAGLVTRYAHLSKRLVKKNQIVTPGFLIAKMGSTGRSTGSHLHFEILKDGHFVDPSLYLKKF